MTAATDREALLRPILENPADDCARLVFADFLEEQGEGERAEFIRVGCELVRRDNLFLVGHPRDVLSRRERSLLLTNWLKWTPRLSTDSSFEVILSKRWTFTGTPACEFRRGFVDAITLPLDLFLKHAKDIFAREPVTRVTLSDRVPLTNQNDRNLFGYFRRVPGSIFGSDNSDLPPELFDLLIEGLTTKDNPLHGWEQLWRDYVNPEAAVADLSAACVTFAREQARLPLLVK